MAQHVSEWLGAYYDGELHGVRLQHVEAHLVQCELCRAELDSLQSLSGVLRQVPTPAFISTKQFSAQVNLRLPHKQVDLTKKQLLELGWWMIPVGILAIWVFLSTSLFIGDLLSTANSLGYLTRVSLELGVGSPDTATWSALLGQFGVLNGESLTWAESTEIFTRATLPQISLQISIALLYLSWLAIWWTRHTRQGHGQLLER